MAKCAGEFGYGNMHEFDPTYNEVNWQEAFEARREAEGIEVPKPVWFESVEGHQFEVHQENCFIFVNETSDPLDCIQLVDPADGGAWTWFREEMGEEVFDRVFQGIGHAATIIHTMYPAKGIQDLFDARATKDVEAADGVPDEWT